MSIHLNNLLGDTAMHNLHKVLVHLKPLMDLILLLCNSNQQQYTIVLLVSNSSPRTVSVHRIRHSNSSNRLGVTTHLLNNSNSRFHRLEDTEHLLDSKLEV
jgi:hypothetical protein